MKKLDDKWSEWWKVDSKNSAPLRTLNRTSARIEIVATYCVYVCRVSSAENQDFLRTILVDTMAHKIKTVSPCGIPSLFGALGPSKFESIASFASSKVMV